MPNLGEIRVNIRLSDTGKEQTADEMKQLVNALRRFRGQPELEDDGKIRLSFNSMQFMPNAINVGFFDGVPWDIGAQALNFCRYGIGMPPNSIDELHSYGFPNRIRSDCELTHFFEHCWYVLKPGGTCHFKGTDLLELMRRCIDRKDCDNDLHIVERQLFTGQDRSGLYFNQCCLTKSRIISRMRHAGFLKIEVHCDDTPGTAALPKEADQIWLRPFTREQMESCLNGNTCIMCGNKRTNIHILPKALSEGQFHLCGGAKQAAWHSVVVG
jgi:hypothetical protein